jgi:hypothetical protein
MPDPDWDLVGSAIEWMDGTDGRSFLSLEVDDGRSLWAAGGDGGLFAVIYMVDVATQESYSLADPERTGPPILLNVQGHATEMQARWCVDRALVLAAFKHFLETSDALPDLAWEASGGPGWRE